MDRLVTFAGFRRSTFGYCPGPWRLAVMPLSGFWLDEDAVYIETLTGEQQLTGLDDIAVYAKAFELLRVASLAGQDAVALIQRVAGDCGPDGVPDPHSLKAGSGTPVTCRLGGAGGPGRVRRSRACQRAAGRRRS